MRTSEMTSLTPRKPRRASLRRKVVQKVSASEWPMSIPPLATPHGYAVRSLLQAPPSTSRRPSVLTPTAIVTATDTIRPASRTFT